MCIYFIKHPSRRKPIGKWHMTMCAAEKAALRAAKKLGQAVIHHWRDGPQSVVFSDGTEQRVSQNMAA